MIRVGTSAVFSFGMLCVAPTLVKVIRLIFAYAAAIGFWYVCCDRDKLCLDLGPLFHQFLGVRWHNVVQTVVFVLDLDGHILHQEAAHRKQGHRHVPLFNL